MKKILLIISIIFFFFGCSTAESKPEIKNEEKLSNFEIKWYGNSDLDEIKCFTLDENGNKKDNPSCLYKTLNGHSGFVNSVVISSDNRYMVSGSDDKTVRLWDVNSGKLLKTLNGHSDIVLSVVISSDNRYIVSGGYDTVKLWDFKSGKLLKTLNGHSDSVASVAISSDNRYIVSGGWDKTVQLWDVNSGKLLKTLNGHNRSVYSVAISSDNRYIVSGSSDKTVKLWDLKSGNIIKTLNGHSDIVLSVAISSDNRYIVSGSWDKTVKLWDVNSGKLLKTLNGHYSVAISSDNRYMVSGSDDKTVRLWDVNSGKLLKTLNGHSDSVHSVAISSDNRYIVSGSWDKTIKIFNIENINYNFKDISNLVQKPLDDYLTLPLVPTPTLPPQEDLVKSQFETKKEFEQRVENTRAKREKEIEQLQDKYRRDVELRNKKLEERRANVENKRLELMQEYINTLFGKPLLKSLTYDAEAQTAFGEIYGENSDFSEKISFKIDPNSAKKLFENPNSINHTVNFEYDEENGLYFKDIKIAGEYTASIADKSYKP